jgi:hypothetical protein
MIGRGMVYRQVVGECGNKTQYFLKALDFIDKSGHLSYQKFSYRQAWNN